MVFARRRSKDLLEVSAITKKSVNDATVAWNEQELITSFSYAIPNDYDLENDPLQYDPINAPIFVFDGFYNLVQVDTSQIASMRKYGGGILKGLPYDLTYTRNTLPKNKDLIAQKVGRGLAEIASHASSNHIPHDGLQKFVIIERDIHRSFDTHRTPQC